MQDVNSGGTDMHGCDIVEEKAYGTLHFLYDFLANFKVLLKSLLI